MMLFLCSSDPVAMLTTVYAACGVKLSKETYSAGSRAVIHVSHLKHELGMQLVGHVHCQDRNQLALEPSQHMLNVLRPPYRERVSTGKECQIIRV